MKILLTSDWYIPAINGVVNSVLNLRYGLEQLGYEVKILTLSYTSQSYSEKGAIYLGSISAGVIYHGARFWFSSGEYLIRELLEWKPDIIHSNCEFSTFRLAKRISEELNIPLVHTYHTVYENYTHYFSPVKKWGKKAVEILSRHVALQTDCLIAPTNKVKKLLERYMVQSPIYVVPTGIDRSQFTGAALDMAGRNIRQKYGIPNENTVLVSVGRLAKEKNCSELLHAFSHFRHEAFTLLMVGDGSCRGELEELSHSLALDEQVIFTGMVRPENVGSYYYAGNLFVCASSSETQGLTYLEALASGLPLLCRRDDCLTGVLADGVNGWQYADITEFCDSLERYREHPEIHTEFRRQALETSQKFSNVVFAETVAQIYLEQIRIAQNMYQEVIR